MKSFFRFLSSEFQSFVCLDRLILDKVFAQPFGKLIEIIRSVSNNRLQFLFILFFLSITNSNNSQVILFLFKVIFYKDGQTLFKALSRRWESNPQP